MNNKLDLLKSFPSNSYEEWRKAAEDLLKGAPFNKKLIKKTYEGIDIQPIYFQSDVENLPQMDAVPGAAPYVRGTKALGPVAESWKIAQELGYAEPADFNKAARNDLERGQNALNILIDKAALSGQDPDKAGKDEVGNGGLSVSTADDLSEALNGIDTDKTPVMMNTGASGLAVTALLLSGIKKQKRGRISGSILADPLGTLAAAGTLPVSMESAYREMAQLTDWTVKNTPGLRTIGVSGIPYHNSGGSAVQELAFAAATAVEYIREMQSRGLEADQTAQKITFCYSIGSDFFMEIAKLRAARLIWEKIADAFGCGNDAKRINMHGRTSSWNKTVTDPYVNMLRVTTEAFAGICGGCDSLHVGAFDEPIRMPDDFSRRIARNVQIVLRDECHFDRIVDPAGGSWYVEKITDQIAKKAWGLFQEVEKKGGMLKALQQGFPQEELAKTAKDRAKNISTRADVFIGTNKYPNLKETPVKANTADYAALKKSRSEKVAKHISTSDAGKVKKALEKLADGISDASGKTMDNAIAAVAAGATLGGLTAAMRSKESPVTITPVKIHRGSAEFESLRKTAEAYKSKTGTAPKIFMANMGPVSQHKARADFSTGFFSVGAFEMISNKGFQSIDEAADAAVKSGAKAVIICSTDETYPEIVPGLTKRIKDADPGIFVILAGYPQDHVEAFKQAGVDDFIHIKSNIYESLNNLQKKLGVA